MRLRAISVRHWGCIESLDLTDLHEGIIVLHGPNRTGKSSLVQALRSCLFDHYHDSQDGVIRHAVPWHAQAAPQVCVELDVGPERYRIAKTFARTKDGQTTLEKHAGEGWRIMERGKDAARKMRELLGVEKSAAGVYQMLWLCQQRFQIPEPQDIDTSLAKSLESVLGTMITARDIDFKNRLDKACEKWFTVKTMKQRKDSPVASRETRLNQARDAKTDIDRQWAEAESALGQFDAARAEKPKLERDLQRAEEEMRRLSAQRDAIALRMSQLGLAEQNRTQAKLLLAQAEKQLQDHAEAKSRLEFLEKNLASAQGELRSADDQVRQIECEVETACNRLSALQKSWDQLQDTRAANADRQKLVDLAKYCQTLDQNLDKIAADQREENELRAALAGPTPLSEKQVEELRKNRQEATKLHAHLQAAEIRVTIQAHQPLDVKLAVDGSDPRIAALPKSGEASWPVRQQADLVLDGLATIRVARGQQDGDLDEMATRLSALNLAFEQSLCAAQVGPDDPTPIDTLVKRRLDHDRRQTEIKRIQDSIRRIAPAGISALEAQRRALHDQQESILSRRPEWTGWTPDQAELDRLLNEFASREAEQKAALQQAREIVDNLESSLDQKQENHRAIETRMAIQTREASAVRERLDQQSSEALTEAVAIARAQLAEADRKVQESALSETERAVEAAYQAAVQTQKLCDHRLRENEKMLVRLETQLAGTEGLHQKRTQAEQTLVDLTRDYERERRNAEAHRRLKELFEQIRQEQVGRTVGPINDRVIDWARQLGLTDYTRLSFGGALLPGGLVPANAVNGEIVGLDQESWGTLEQLSLLIRLAVGGLLARDEPTVAIFDDPLAHADLAKHRKMLEIFEHAVRGESHPINPAGPLQLIILTCHPERFESLTNAQHIDLGTSIRRGMTQIEPVTATLDGIGK